MRELRGQGERVHVREAPDLSLPPPPLPPPRQPPRRTETRPKAHRGHRRTGAIPVPGRNSSCHGRIGAVSTRNWY